MLRTNRVSSNEFLEAARTGNLVIVERYITDLHTCEPLREIDASLNPADRTSPEQMQQRLAENNAHIKAGINVTDAQGHTAFMLATLHGHANILKLLQPVAGIDVNRADREGNTPLHHAINNSHRRKNYLFDLLISFPGINVNAANNIGRTPLMVAAQHCNTGILDRLLALPGIGIDDVDKNGNTALMLAVDVGNIIFDDEDSNASILRAAQKNQIQAIRKLLASGANIHKQNNDTDTAEDTAHDAADYLLKHDRTSSVKDNLDDFILLRNRRVIHHPEEIEQYTNISVDSAIANLNFLLAHLHDIDFSNLPDLLDAFGTLLARTATPRNTLRIPDRMHDAAKLLVEEDFTEENHSHAVSKPTSNDKPIKRHSNLRAAADGDIQTVQQFMAQNINNPSYINATDEHGENTLIHAIRNNRIYLVRFLMGVPGLNINAVNNSGVTALMIAADRGYTACMKLLLGKNANVNLADSRGYTALMRAVNKRHIDAVKLLLDNDAEVGKRTVAMAVDNDTIKYFVTHYKAPKLNELLDLFIMKRLRQVKRLVKEDDLAGMQELADISMSSALSDIVFLTAHADQVTSTKLAKLVLAFAKLLICVNHGSIELDDHARALLFLGNQLGDDFCDRVVNNLNVKPSMPDHYPAQFTLFGVSQSKVSAPKAVAILKQMRRNEETKLITPLIARQFLNWADKTNKHYSGTAIKEINSMAKAKSR